MLSFIAAASVGKEESGHGREEFLILTELCTGGWLEEACVGLVVNGLGGGGEVVGVGVVWVGVNGGW